MFESRRDDRQSPQLDRTLFKDVPADAPAGARAGLPLTKLRVEVVKPADLTKSMQRLSKGEGRSKRLGNASIRRYQAVLGAAWTWAQKNEYALTHPPSEGDLKRTWKADSAEIVSMTEPRSSRARGQRSC